MNNKFREFAKYLLLAQVASDAGKGYISSRANNIKNALDKNYGLKDRYIAQAIALAKGLGNVKVSLGVDEYLGMDVVYFDIKGYGQVSFHSYKDWSYTGLPYNGKWNGIRGGSLMTCRKLAKKLNLPYYNHK